MVEVFGLKFVNKNSGRLISRESSAVEFKESFVWGDRESYGKTMAAFANNKGGRIFFGIRNLPREFIGLADDVFEKFDEATITQYLASIFSREIFFEKEIHTSRGKKLGVLIVHESALKPVVVTKTLGTLRDGEIYFRYTGKTDKIRHPELSTLLAAEHVKLDDKWRTLLKSMVRVPDVANVTISDKGNPIRITNKSSAPEMRISEDPTIGGYTLYYSDLQRKMRERLSGFKADKKFVNIVQKLREDAQYCRTRFLNPNNPKSAKTRLYHPRILNAISARYKKK